MPPRKLRIRTLVLLRSVRREELLWAKAVLAAAALAEGGGSAAAALLTRGMGHEEES